MDVFALQRALIDRYNFVVTRDLFDEVDSLFPGAEKGEAVSFDGTRLHYITLGKGLPLMICNGVWCTYTYHHYMADYFRDRCRLILWDYRGHSRSQVPEDPCSFTMENFARDAAAATNEREQQLRESGAVEDRGTAPTGRVGATYDYLLTAEVQGIATSSRDGQSDYFLIAFKLVDFKDVLVWEDQYEFKKEGRESAIYR